MPRRISARVCAHKGGGGDGARKCRGYCVDCAKIVTAVYTCVSYVEVCVKSV